MCSIYKLQQYFILEFKEKLIYSCNNYRDPNLSVEAEIKEYKQKAFWRGIVEVPPNFFVCSQVILISPFSGALTSDVGRGTGVRWLAENLPLDPISKFRYIARCIG